MPASEVRDQLQRSLAGTYTIERELGGGGMSRVYVAEELKLGRTVVIKLLAADLAEGISSERFEREIRVAARLQHPHVVPLFSAGTANGIPFYTMPYIDGESLRSRLLRGPLKVSEAIHILRDIARALEYAHKHDVIHRDIKPDNVLLSGNSACVTDFGIAKAIRASRTGGHPDIDTGPGDALTRFGMTVGTPAYMSPEQATCRDDLDHRADLYSFGCMAFEFLTGGLPFPKRDPQAMLIAHIMETPPLGRLRRPDIPRALADMVGACMAKEPADRPADASVILEALEASTSRSFTPAGGVEMIASIAVMPFENMSDDRENEFFADGITEEIINSLTQLAGLRVAGRSSSFAFKGMKQQLATVAEKLNVAHVLEGSVRKSGNRLRITAQLIKVSDGYHLWSEKFDRELTDVFAVQEEIATAIASKLRLTLGRSGDLVRPPTTSIEAYEEFLKARVLFYRLGRYVVEAIGHFQRAVDLDEAFGLAHAGLADALNLSSYYGLARPKEIMERARLAARRAVEVAPETPEAHHALALWMTFHGGDRHGAIEEWDRSVSAASPSTQVRCSHAIWGVGLLGGKWDQAVAEMDAVIAADPLNGYAHSMAAFVRSFAGRLDNLVTLAQLGIEFDPESFWGHLALQRAYHHVGLHAEAQAQGQVTLAMSGRHPWSLAELAVDHASIGNAEAADAIYSELLSRNRVERLQPSPVALAAVAAGKFDDAIELCYKAIEERDAHILWALSERWRGWERLYEHPGWRSVRKGILSWRPHHG